MEIIENQPESQLTLFETALARSEAYSLWGRLFAHGLGKDLLPWIEQIPDFAETLANLPLKPFYDDSLAAEHYRVFGMNVFAHESMFLDPEANLGGPVASRVTDFYLRCGFHTPDASDSADSISGELAFLAFLCLAEADAHEDRLPQQVARLRNLQLDFLSQHLLRWVPGLNLALQSQGNDFYAVAAIALEDLLCDHARELARSQILPGRLDFDLPPVPDLFADKKTSLRDIAGYLVIPAYSGIYLSREGISRLARRFRLPRGFGSRQDLLANLLHSAVHFNVLDEVLVELIAMVEFWKEQYSLHCQDVHPISALSLPWLQRQENTLDVLATIRNQASSVAAE